MTELNKIEESLREIDAATFQKLCDEYLLREKGGQLFSLGSEDGANKTTKGTPDTYIIKENNKMILAEYTTQKNNLDKKINSDLRKIDKSNIEKKNVIEIVYCASDSNITAEYSQELENKYKKAGIKFTFVSNKTLSIDIRDKYRDLAQKYLGFELMSVQLKNIVDFADEYNKQSNGSLLNTYFGYRDIELKEIKNFFETNNAVLVTGNAGIGKTRLAFEFAKTFSGDKFFVHNVYDIKELISEMQTEFVDLTPKLIVFDDADQIDNLKKIFQAFLQQLNSGRIKILITVRNYAKDKVRGELKNYIPVNVINLQSLSSEQIRKCVEKVYKINNEVVLDRICEISYGNLRMAMLTSLAYLKNKNIVDIADESEVYDTLLSGAIQTISKDNEKLINLGIIAFFQHFDTNFNNYFKYPLYMNVLQKLNISVDKFKKDINLFNKIDLIDFVNSRFVNFSDQTLENYVLKVVFLDKKLLSLSQIIKMTFDLSPNLVYKNVINLSNTFYNKRNKRYLTKQIKIVWQYLKNKNDKQYLKFVAFFAEFDIDEAIILVDERIRQIKQYTDKVSYKIKNDEVFNDPILKIIDSILYCGNYKYATDLLYNYLIKQPQKFNQFYLAITQDWRITYSTFRYTKFKSQIYLINKLIRSSVNQESVTQLLLAIIPKYLSLVIENVNESINDDKHIIIKHFQVIATKENLKFREYIWEYLNKISVKNSIRVQKIVRNYGRDLFFFRSSKISSSTKKVINFDIEYLTFIIKNVFNIENPSDCIAVSWLQDRLNLIGIKLPVANQFINNKDYKLYKDLQNIMRTRALNKDDKLKEYSKVNLCNGILDLKRVLDLIKNLEEHNINVITIGLNDILENIFNELKNNKEEYIKGVKILISSHINNDMLFREIFEYMSNNYLVSEITSLLNYAPEYKKDFLYYLYFCSLPKNQINKENYDLLKKYLSNETIADIGPYKIRNLGFLYKFNIFDPSAFEICCNIIYLKGLNFRKIYFHLLYLDKDQTEKIVNSFQNIDLLENIYVDCMLNDNDDFSTPYLLVKIYEKDKLFLNEYINKILIRHLETYQLDNECQLLELIKENKDEEILNKIWNTLWKTNNNNLLIVWSEVLAKWTNENGDAKPSISTWIKKFIKENHSNNLKIFILMEGMANQNAIDLIEYIKEYILTKPSIKDFEKIPLYSLNYSIEDNESSINKVFESDINNLKQLSEWLVDKGLNYILYKKRVDQCIKWREQDREEELGKLRANIF